MENNLSPENLDSKKIYATKLKYIALGVGLLVFVLMVAASVIKSNKKKPEVSEDSVTINLDAGTAAADTDKMWRKNVDDKLENQQKDILKKLEELQKQLSEKTSELENKREQDSRYLRDKTSFLEAVIEENKQQGTDVDIANDALEKAPKITRHTVNLTNSKNSKDFEPLKTPENYIPATTMIKAVTLNGLRVSTAVNKMSDPDVIVIELVDNGILPNKYRNHLKDCRIAGDAYGELSSKTVKIRTTKLACTEITTGEAVETDLAGFVVGEDGYQGIKGEVVSTEQKYLANASIFGIMGGFANIGVKDSTQYNPFTIGTGSVKPMTDKQKATNSLMSGTSNSLDKLSDYYIAQAEKLSPVIEIPAGQRVTVALIKGTYFGTSTFKKSLAKKQEEAIKKTADQETNNLMEDMEIKS